MSPRIFDTHCHIADPAFDEDRGEVIARMREAGVCRANVVADPCEETPNQEKVDGIVRGGDGLLHIFVTTTDNVLSRGCLVHLTSADGEHFTEQGNIYTAPEGEDEPECSDYIAYRGRYYLIFSHHGKGQYRVSDKPFSDWKTPDDPLIPCSSVPKCAVWNDRILFTGFRSEGGYAGTLTFMEAKVKEDGTFTFMKVPETEAYNTKT